MSLNIRHLIPALILLPLAASAGNLDSPAAPDDVAGAMYTVQDICNRLDAGTAGTKRGAGFVEPTAGPGSTGCTLDQIMSKAPAADNSNGAAPADVQSGKTYWGLRTDGTWGPQTGANTWTPTCSGTLNGTRWCDNGDGTVTDMTTGLVWLKDASWGSGYAFWVDTASGTNAHDRAAQAKNGTPSTLSDGSAEGDWRLPTYKELLGLANGTEAVRSGTPRAFSGVSPGSYWASATRASHTPNAWLVNLKYGTVNINSDKTFSYAVWPVRGRQ